MTRLRCLLFSLLVCLCAAKRPDDCPVQVCPKECPKPSNCTGGLAYDYRYCECCIVCAKVEGEICGGRFQEKGTCDKGFICITNSAGVGTCQERKCPPPPTNLLCPLLPHTCKDDADCDDGTNCCFDGCRRRCREPANSSAGPNFGKQKPGKCPALHRPVFCAADVDECHYDWDCTGDKRCCDNGCYKECASPTSSAVSALAKCAAPKGNFTCPVSLASSCLDDKICQERSNPETRCCFDGCRRDCLYPNASRPVTIRRKPGECPDLTFYNPCVSDNDECIFDAHCFGDKKCCSNTCFKVCAKPKPKQGSGGASIGSILLPSQCRNMTLGKECHVGLAHTCVEDDDCVSGTYCCFDNCRRMCRHPKGKPSEVGLSKSGECPADLPSPVYCASDVDECINDYDCVQDKKCCSNSCYKMCVSPSLSIGAAAYKCPFVTKSYQCHGGFKHFCEDDQQCKIGGQFCCFDGCRRRCQDPRAELESRTAGAGISVFCLKDMMRIDIDKTELNGLKVFDLQLNDPQCKATSNFTHYSLEAPLVGCGTGSSHKDDSIVYSNEVVQNAQREEGIITRDPDLNIPFACLYSKEGVTSTYGLKPRHKKVINMHGGETETQFTLELSLFRDEGYLNPYSTQDYPLPVTIDEPTYVQASVDTKDKWLEVTADACYATPTPNQDDPKKYYLIRDGCQVDATVRNHPAPGTKFRFQFDPFNFVGESHSFIYLHCHMMVCNVSDPDSRCSLGCLQLPRKRRASEEAGAKLSQGPLVLVGDESHLANRLDQGASSNYITWVVVAMAAFCALCLSTIVYMKLKKNAPRPDPDRETYI